MLNQKRLRLANISKNSNFLSKLYDILNDSTYKDIISWNDEGTHLLIKDTYKLSDEVLPKYYNHRKYSSFVRQLNMYGFYKTKDIIIKDVEVYRHDNFDKNCKKGETKNIITIQGRKKIYKDFIQNGKENTINNDNVPITNRDDILKDLLVQNEKVEKEIISLKEEIKDLKEKNEYLTDNYKNLKDNLISHSYFLKKYLKNSSKMYKNKTFKKKPKNIKELFKYYLYYLRIYSPYVTIKNENIYKLKYQRIDSFKLERNKTINNNRIEIYSFINNNIPSFNYNNNDIFFEEIPFLNLQLDTKFSDLNLTKYNIK